MIDQKELKLESSFSKVIGHTFEIKENYILLFGLCHFKSFPIFQHSSGRFPYLMFDLIVSITWGNE